jgi:hypothetical protein
MAASGSDFFFAFAAVLVEVWVEADAAAFPLETDWRP